MRIRITYRGNGPSGNESFEEEGRPWFPSILSLGLHVLGLVLIFVVADSMGPDTPLLPAGSHIQYISLKASTGGLIWYPPETSAPAAAASSPEPVFSPSEPKSIPRASAGLDAAATPVSRPSRAKSIEPPSAAGLFAAPLAIGQAATDPWGSAPNTAAATDPAALVAALGKLFDVVPPGRPGELRIVHPEDGRFPMVLSRTTAPDGVPEEFFQGRMIYTVYLDVGTARKWMLHYSSTDPQVRMSGNVIRIAAVERMEAPYPRITIVPSDDTSFGENRLTVTGVLNSEGKLRALRPAGNPDAEASNRLVALLERWSFRPAKKAGLPSDVAIVLVVPQS